jgi:hypothetical protein
MSEEPTPLDFVKAALNVRLRAAIEGLRHTCTPSYPRQRSSMPATSPRS